MANRQCPCKRYWLDHIQAAADFEGTTADYARVHHLKTRDIYNWKSKLLKLNLYQPFKSVVASDFISVKPSSPKASLTIQKPIHIDRSGCTVILTNGTQIDFHGELSPGIIRSIMTTVSQSH